MYHFVISFRQSLYRIVKPEKKCLVTIPVTDMFNGFVACAKDICLSQMLDVKFVDDVGASTGAIDEGGPSREFIQTIMDHLPTLNIFRGRENSKTLQLLYPGNVCFYSGPNYHTECQNPALNHRQGCFFLNLLVFKATVVSISFRC